MAKTKIAFINRQDNFNIDKDLKSLLRKAAKTTLKNENIDFDCEITVSFVDNEEIKKLNNEYRNKNKVTDVLSFPLGENGNYDINPENNMYMLGDVILNLERAELQSIEYDHSFEREVSYLTVHSILHLLGYDHMNKDDKKLMRTREKEIMEILDLQR